MDRVNQFYQPIIGNYYYTNKSYFISMYGTLAKGAKVKVVQNGLEGGLCVVQFNTYTLVIPSELLL